MPDIFKITFLSVLSIYIFSGSSIGSIYSKLASSLGNLEGGLSSLFSSPFFFLSAAGGFLAPFLPASAAKDSSSLLLALASSRFFTYQSYSR
jgi:hypothetical protein